MKYKGIMESQNSDSMAFQSLTCGGFEFKTLDEDSIRLVVLGEASMLSTAILRGAQRSSGSLRSSSGSVPSRLATMVAEYEEEDDDDETVSDPLLKSLIRLKAKLRKDKFVVTDPNYLRPFCDVIKNKDVSGPVTGLALQSILKFINYGLIKSDDNAVKIIADSVTKARFVGTDTSNDEVVLMRILNVLRELIVRRFSCLSNSAVCEIMQSCFRIAFEPRLSELLRKSSEQSLIDMVQVLFQRICEFNQKEIDASSSDFKMTGKFNLNMLRKSKSFNDKHKNKNESQNDSQSQYYGLECIHELLTYLTSLINPLPEGQNSEAMISVGLTLLTVAFETSVHGIGSKQCLLSTVKNDLSWSIMLLLQNDRPLNSFASSLRLAFLIFTNLRMHLKYQFESLMHRLMDIITTGNAPFEFREIALEYLVAFFRHLSHLPHEIYLNFDCDPYASNLLEDLLQLFSKNCFATSSNNQQITSVSGQGNAFSPMQMLSLDALLASLKSLQKAELHHNDSLIVFPAAAIKMEHITMPSNTKDTDSISIKSPDDKQIDSDEYENLSPIATEEIDVGIADIGTDPLPSPVDHNDLPILKCDDDQNEQKELEKEPEKEPEKKHFEPMKVNVQYRTAVTYTYPKIEKVPINVADIDQLKQRKRLLWMASDQFNLKPAKGIQFLSENHLVSGDLDIVLFLRDNPKLDKKQIGEYLSNKKNLKILKSFVESFAFKGLRIDESLRIYLESFRLPGESPLISLILEQFAHHWHESNDCPFVNEDAAFSLSYAIIMLNVDQHNTNVKRQTNPMTCGEFISNLRQVNGGKDFDSEMLKDVYFTIKTNEIIMPAEQHGIVRERYLWKCLLRKSETDNGVYWYKRDDMKPYEQVINCDKNNEQIDNEGKTFRVILSTLNGPIFAVLWGPTVAAMTFIFDKIIPDQQSGLSRRILNNGFNSCALLCATYGHLDNLIVSLSKFIQSSSNSASPIMTIKSQNAAQCLFSITREYSNEMRESWSNIIELILHWYIAKLLDNAFEFEDFALNSKKIKLKRKENKSLLKNVNDAGSSTFLSSFYSYFAGNQQNDPSNNQIYNNQLNSDSKTDESEAVHENSENSSTHLSHKTYSQPLLLIIEDSKFLHIDSLLELIKALINVHLENTEENDDDIEVFKLEVLLQIILMNRDRVSVFWPQVSRYLLRLYRLCPKSEYLNERVISAIFRLAIRFVPRPDCLSEQIFILLCHLLVTFEPNMIQKKYTAIALHSFVTHCHGYITRAEDWSLIFDLLLYIGIGFRKRSMKTFESEASSVGAQSEPEDNFETIPTFTRGYTSDSEIDNLNNKTTVTVVQSHDQSQMSINPFRLINTGSNGNINAISYRILDLEAYEKCTEILTLIIREILPNVDKGQNEQKVNSKFTSVTQLAVETLQNFVEASVKIQISPGKSGQLRRSASHHSENRRGKSKSRAQSNNKSRLSRIANAILSSSESEGEDDTQNSGKSDQNKNQPKLSSVTETCALKLLDLMHYMHLNAAITMPNASEHLWSAVWCPLLQGIALFCCDSRRPVRTCAITFLQRALLLHDLRILSASQWENCFNKILFPLLSKLLEPLNMYDPIGMDETRMRITNLLCKVFLQHLTPLLTLPTFTALWLTILDFMDKYIKAEMQTDLVREAIPESLKNILLVMDTAGCFNDTLAAITWDRIAIFLPNLRHEIMPPQVTNNEETAESSDIKVEESGDGKGLRQQLSDPKNNVSNASQPLQHPSQSCPLPQDTVSHSTFINIEDYPKTLQYAHSLGPVPGSSVIAPSVPFTSQTVFYPQPSHPSAYPWPAPSDPKVYPTH